MDSALLRDAPSEIRLVHAHSAPTCDRVADVLSTIWGATGPDGHRQMIDSALLVAIAHAGNYVALAEDEDGPVGAAVGFCGPPGTPFHSHIVGLLPTAVGRGLGRAVKLAQREWCLDRGITAMTWTYDPLVARNAFFNIRRVGAAVSEHLPDFYGAMTDGINAGQNSDRFLVHWDLTAPPAAATLPEPVVDDAQHAVDDVAGAPSEYVRPLDPSKPALIAVPSDIEALRRTDPLTADLWRARTRGAFTDLMDSGWAVTDFARSATTGGHYVLRKEGTR